MEHAAPNCVIIGRAGSFVLRDHPGVVRVFVHAPERWRIERLAGTLGTQDRHAARDLIQQNDHDRAKFVQAVCGCGGRPHCDSGVAAIGVLAA